MTTPAEPQPFTAQHAPGIPAQQSFASPPAAPAPNPGRNGFATTALVVGIVGVCMAFIPIIGMVAFILCPVAIVFGVLSLKSEKRGFAIAGLSCGIVGLAISILWAALFTAAVGGAAKSVNNYTSCVNAAKAAYPGTDLTSLNNYFAATAKC